MVCPLEKKASEQIEDGEVTTRILICAALHRLFEDLPLFKNATHTQRINVGVAVLQTFGPKSNIRDDMSPSAVGAPSLCSRASV